MEAFMTEDPIFETDCISSFLWVGEEKLLLNLYPGQMILPKQVYYELSNPSVPHLGLKIRELCELGNLRLAPIFIDTKEYEIYYELAVSPPKRRYCNRERGGSCYCFGKVA